jgi:hypothetical protein
MITAITAPKKKMSERVIVNKLANTYMLPLIRFMRMDFSEENRDVMRRWATTMLT